MRTISLDSCRHDGREQNKGGGRKKEVVCSNAYDYRHRFKGNRGA